MFNVIRIPTKFTKSLERLSKTDRLEIFDLLLKVSKGEKVEVPDTAMGDILTLIYGDWVRMESKNGNKIQETLLISDCGLLGECERTTGADDPIINSTEQDSIEQNNTLGESKKFISENIKDGNITALLLDIFIKLGYIPTESIGEFRDWIKTRIYEVYDFNYKEFEIVTMKFYDYWIQESPQKRKNKNWKATFNNSFDLKTLKLK